MPGRQTILGTLTIPIRVTSRGANRGLRVTTKSVRDAARAMKGMERQGYRLNRAIQQQHRRIFSLHGAMALAAGSTGAGYLIRRFTQVADRMTLAESRVRLVTRTTRELRDVQEQVFAIAQRSRSEYFLTTDLYARLARSTQHLHIEQSRLLRVTEAINKAAIIGGATNNEYTAGIIQLSQGFASGVLHGDELRSVLEQLPRVAQAIATGLGVDRGQLREIGELRELTVGRVLQAIESQFASINRDFLLVERTVHQAVTQTTNVIERGIQRANENSVITRQFIDQIDELRFFLSQPTVQNTAIGAVQKLVGFTTVLAKNLDTLGIAIATYFGVRLTGRLVSIVSSMLALIRRTDSAGKALLGFLKGPRLALVAIGAAIVGAVGYMTLFKDRTEDAITAGKRLAEQSIVPNDLAASLRNITNEIDRVRREIDALQERRQVAASQRGDLVGAAVLVAEIIATFLGGRIVIALGRWLRGAVPVLRRVLGRAPDVSRNLLPAAPGRRLLTAPAGQRALPAGRYYGQPVGPGQLLLPSAQRRALPAGRRQLLLPAPRTPSRQARVSPAGNIFTVDPSGGVGRGLSVNEHLRSIARRGEGGRDLRETLERLARSSGGRAAALTAVAGALTAQGVQAAEANKGAELLVSEQARQNRVIKTLADRNAERVADIEKVVTDANRRQASINPLGTVLAELFGADPRGKIEDELRRQRIIEEQLVKQRDEFIRSQLAAPTGEDTTRALDLNRELQRVTTTPTIPVNPVTKLLEQARERLQAEKDTAAQLGIQGRALSVLTARQATARDFASLQLEIENEISRLQASLAIVRGRQQKAVEVATRQTREQLDATLKLAEAETDALKRRELENRADELAGTVAAQTAAEFQRQVKGQVALEDQLKRAQDRRRQVTEAISNGDRDRLVNLRVEAAETARINKLKESQLEITKQLASSLREVRATALEDARAEAETARESLVSQQAALSIARERLRLLSLRGGTGDDTPGQTAGFEFLEDRLSALRNVAAAQKRLRDAQTFGIGVLGRDPLNDPEALRTQIEAARVRLAAVEREQGVRAQTLAAEKAASDLRTATEAAQREASDRLERQQQRIIRHARTFSTTLSSGIRRAISQAESFGDVIRDILAGALQGAGRIGLDRIFRNIFANRGGGGGGGLSLIRAVVPSRLPGRRYGGMMYRGRGYVTGEDGPEVVFPGQTSRVAPLKPAGGGTVVYLTQEINVESTDGPGVTRAVERLREELTAVSVDAAVTKVAGELRRPNGRFR